ncbi:ac4 [Peridroma alphabaculovirus]|uniref:Ac4 n=1 Tax=Peridroma alphabaculovirus TaxID=1346829 RepID=A0A068LKP3_9ABAC|nr:ac4 [Peridroma alphabaculovirus]AIE47758.1 ac4 [Peridroma alphabaculovirus]
MSIKQYIKNILRKYDGDIPPFVDPLAELHAHVLNSVSDADATQLRYPDRNRLVADVMHTIIDAYLPAQHQQHEDVVCYRVCAECDRVADKHHRKIVTVKRYVCRSCGALMVHDDHDPAQRRRHHHRHHEVGPEDSASSDSSVSDVDDLDDDDDKHKTVVPSSGLAISKWTWIKLATEAFLLVRCWVWGLCDKPWYILWSKKPQQQQRPPSRPTSDKSM